MHRIPCRILRQIMIFTSIITMLACDETIPPIPQIEFGGTPAPEGVRESDVRRDLTKLDLLYDTFEEFQPNVGGGLPYSNWLVYAPKDASLLAIRSSGSSWQNTDYLLFMPTRPGVDGAHTTWKVTFQELQRRSSEFRDVERPLIYIYSDLTRLGAQDHLVSVRYVQKELVPNEGGGLAVGLEQQEKTHLLRLMPNGNIEYIDVEHILGYPAWRLHVASGNGRTYLLARAAPENEYIMMLYEVLITFNGSILILPMWDEPVYGSAQGLSVDVNGAPMVARNTSVGRMHQLLHPHTGEQTNEYPFERDPRPFWALRLRSTPLGAIGLDLQGGARLLRSAEWNPENERWDIRALELEGYDEPNRGTNLWGVDQVMGALQMVNDRGNLSTTNLGTGELIHDGLDLSIPDTRLDDRFAVVNGVRVRCHVWISYTFTFPMQTAEGWRVGYGKYHQLQCTPPDVELVAEEQNRVLFHYSYIETRGPLEAEGP